MSRQIGRMNKLDQTDQVSAQVDRIYRHLSASFWSDREFLALCIVDRHLAFARCYNQKLQHTSRSSDSRPSSGSVTGSSTRWLSRTRGQAPRGPCGPKRERIHIAHPDAHTRATRMYGVYIINKRDFIRSHADPCGYQRHYNARKLISRLNLSTFL